jgi:hypothetical protein
MSTELGFQERETVDRIREAVESSLKTRYTVIGLITAALISGGAYTSFNALTGKAQEEITRADILLKNAEELIKELQKKLEIRQAN